MFKPNTCLSLYNDDYALWELQG